MSRGRNPEFQAYVWDVMEKLPIDVSVDLLAQKVGCSQGILKKCLTNMVKRNRLGAERQRIWEDRLSINGVVRVSDSAPPERLLPEIPEYVTAAIYGQRRFRVGMIPVGERVHAINAFIHAEGSILDAAIISSIPHKRLHIAYDDWEYIPKEHFGRLSAHSWKARAWLKGQLDKAEKKAHKAEVELKDVRGEPEPPEDLQDMPAADWPKGDEEIDERIRAIAGAEIDKAFREHADATHNTFVITHSHDGVPVLSWLTAPFRFAGRRVVAISRAVIRG